MFRGLDFTHSFYYHFLLVTVCRVIYTLNIRMDSIQKLPIRPKNLINNITIIIIIIIITTVIRSILTKLTTSSYLTHKCHLFIFLFFIKKIAYS